MQKSEQDKIKKRNTKAENIARRSDEKAFVIQNPTRLPRDPYPWEERFEGKLTKITKEYFRCKGSSSHLPKKDDKDPSQYIFDCKGPDRHSLPIRDGKEYIYPILIDLLNYIQKTTAKKVSITCGHRCMAHNGYAEPSAQASKHMMGAEADFYVQGFENNPEEVLKVIMSYYQNDPFTRQKKEYTEFKRYEKKDVNVSILPWYNKEIFIKLYKKDEGRDFDNRHPYPYIGIQVRYDREKNEVVNFNPAKASSSMMKY